MPHVDIPFIKKPLSETVFLDSKARKRQIQQLQAAFSEDRIGTYLHNKAMSQYNLNEHQPIRQYYHEETNIPMVEGEWRHDDQSAYDDSLRDSREKVIILIYIFRRVNVFFILLK